MLRATGLPEDPIALLCLFRLIGVLSSRAAACVFGMVACSLEVFSPALLWCYDHKGPLSV